MRTDFNRVLDSRLPEVAVLADEFSAWAETLDAAPATVYALNVVLEELVTNVIVHGLGDGQPGQITVKVWCEAADIYVELRDTAPPFDPFQIPPPNLTLDIDERAIGGLGVHFVRTLMDEWRYVREEGENVVHLRKQCHAGAAS